MSPKQLEDDPVDDADVATTADAENADAENADAASGDEKEPERLDLEVQVDSPGACERHVTVTISRADIDRYLNDAFSEMMPKANVAGFRVGRAPRKVVEGHFRQEVTDRIKGTLLMDSLEQISEAQDFAAISEPDLDLDAVEVPREGPMTFEFRIEVRPEFDMPQWKGLTIKRPTRDISDEDIDRQIEQMLARYGQLAPHNDAATEGDYLSVDITTTHNGKELESEKEHILRIRPKLSFIDTEIDDFAKLVDGVKAGDKRTAEVKLLQDAPNAALRGETVSVEFNVLEVKKLKLPELNAEFLQEIGNFESVDDFRDAIRRDLERQLEYEQQKVARQQITSLLTKSADWDLPPGLLERQSSRELERAVMEMRRSGFSEAEIRARENVLRQNSAASTATALKEHFILERIAEDESLEVEDGDYDREVTLMALQSGESPRRVRAQLEKRGLMDVLRNQIIERKVLARVQSEAKFKDEKYEPKVTDTEALHIAAGGPGASSIPNVTKAVEEAGETETESA
jgi:trigger factor